MNSSLLTRGQARAHALTGGYTRLYVSVPRAGGTEDPKQDGVQGLVAQPVGFVDLGGVWE